MADPNPIFDARRFTLSVVMSFAVLFIFTMLIMLWHGSFEKDANGKLHYNTRVVEPNSNY